MDSANSKRFLAVQWTYTPLTLALVVNRLFVRRRLAGRRKFFCNTPACWSDCFVVVAWIFYLGQNLCEILLMARGKSPDDVLAALPLDVKQEIYNLKLFYVESVIYYIPLYCIKGAILCFFLEVTTPAFVWVRRAVWFCFVLVIGAGIATVCIFLFACEPISSWWSLDFLDVGYCWPLKLSARILLPIHLFTDIYVYVVLFFIIRCLNTTTWQQRVAVGVIFVLGAIELAISAMQLAGNVVSIGGSAIWLFWVALHEQTLAIVIVCLPMLRFSINRLFREIRKGKTQEKSNRASFRQRLRRGFLTTREVANTENNATKGQVDVSIQVSSAMESVIVKGKCDLDDVV